MRTDKWVNLTANVSTVCAIRGQILPVIRHVPSSKATTITNDWVGFSIGSVTHMDLPWSMDWGRVAKIVTQHPHLFPESMLRENYFENLKKQFNIQRTRSARSKYLKSYSFPCIILDATHTLEVIENYLEKYSAYSSIPFYLDPTMDSSKFESLLQEIGITAEWIQNVEKQYQLDVSDKFILFRTGWSERFYCAKTDLGNPIFEGWHAYLTHPYLQPDAVRYLASKNVRGIGVDAPSLENPLGYADSSSDQYQHYLRHLVATLKPVAPLHIIFLAQGRFLIENLVNLGAESIGSKLPATGVLFLFPYEMGTESACPVIVYISMEGQLT